MSPSQTIDAFHPDTNPLAAARRLASFTDPIDTLDPADRQRVLDLNRLAIERGLGSVQVGFDREDKLVYCLNRWGMPTGYATLDDLAEALRALGVDADPAVVAAEQQQRASIEARIARARERAKRLGAVLHKLKPGSGAAQFVASHYGSSWTNELADVDAVEAWLIGPSGVAELGKACSPAARASAPPCWRCRRRYAGMCVSTTSSAVARSPLASSAHGLAQAFSATCSTQPARRPDAGGLSGWRGSARGGRRWRSRPRRQRIQFVPRRARLKHCRDDEVGSHLAAHALPELHPLTWVQVAGARLDQFDEF